MKKQITVNGIEVAVKNKGTAVYLCLSDIAKLKNAKDPRFAIMTWMRSKEIISYLGLWETMNNPDFNRVEFDTVRDKEAGYNVFSMSPTQWIERTNAKGMVTASGRYGGGTFAHSDIALEFASWVSVEFKLYLVKEFQRLKSEEQKHLEWSAKRELDSVHTRCRSCFLVLFAPFCVVFSSHSATMRRRKRLESH